MLQVDSSTHSILINVGNTGNIIIIEYLKTGIFPKKLQAMYICHSVISTEAKFHAMVEGLNALIGVPYFLSQRSLPVTTGHFPSIEVASVVMVHVIPI